MCHTQRKVIQSSLNYIYLVTMGYLTNYPCLFYNTENSAFCSQFFRGYENLGTNSPKFMSGMSLIISPTSASAAARQTKHHLLRCGGTQRAKEKASKLKPAHRALTSFTGEVPNLKENKIV